MRRLLVSSLVVFAACTQEAPAPDQLSSFTVTSQGVFVRAGGNRTPLGVVAACVARYGSLANVPDEARGTKDCRYIIPAGEVEFDITAQAMDITGNPITNWSGSVSFRVIPGDLPQELPARWALVNNGLLKTTIRAQHPYSEVRVWVEDAPPKLIFDGGVVNPGDLPPEPQPPAHRTFAAGTTPIIYFGDQTLQSLQFPGVLDNRSSPFAGEFVVVGKNPSSGETLKQTCSDDPARNGRDALMVVTGLDPSGFYVTDISACRLREQLTDSLGSSVRTAEPPETCVLASADGGTTENLDGGMGTCPISQKACRKTADCFGYSPGTFASMFVYNYNFPDGLDQGDLLFTLSGSVQEFTSTTQLVFPAWTTAERVRQLPQEQWDKWLKYAPPYDINARTCGADDTATPFLTDALCGHNKRNMKMESLESGLVRLRRVRFPQKFVNCDFNSDGTVPFFCETKPQNADWQWSTCSFDAPEPDADRVERECNQNCVIGMGDQTGVICSEESTFKGFGQYVVETRLPGPSRLGLDDALKQRMQVVTAGVASASTDGGTAANPVVRAVNYAAGNEVVITCDRPTRYAVGAGTVTVSPTDPVLVADQMVRHVFTGQESAVAFQATTEAATCSVGLNSHTRINIVTKDAVPELNPDCDENDADATKAERCKDLRGSEFDIVGHLRQVQPARPRWVVTPRDVDDLCCYPGPGLQCPKPIKPCQLQ